jgi:seryl-tRNA synthetase
MQWTSNGVHFRVICSPLISFLTVFTGAKISGHRGYFLTNDGIDLNQALISYGLDFLRKRGYRKIQPPFMMNKDVMAKTAQLDQFDEELYKVHRTLNTQCFSVTILAHTGHCERRREIPYCHLGAAHLGIPLG